MSRNYRKIFITWVFLILLVFQVSPSLAPADDHKKSDRHYKQYKISKEFDDFFGHNRRQEKKEDEGNETTGQSAAWILVLANLTVAFSIFVKAMTHFFPLDSKIKNSMKRFNQLQKKHLMRFHYVLNPIALCIAFFHFLLSFCRSSPLPEWSLILVAIMVSLGLILKFKVSPRGMRKFVYRLHTASATFLIMILLIVVGHQIVD
ncbi:MAG: hypothetical protein SRB2_03826 [Desulfobacteraceae bacterium Eth-SRB2]|nr:MAG: hypothetical protein SRB2_03826 [Desulfobacteraceae bacterium Eth-SRB2]